MSAVAQRIYRARPAGRESLSAPIIERAGRRVSTAVEKGPCVIAAALSTRSRGLLFAVCSPKYATASDDDARRRSAARYPPVIWPERQMNQVGQPPTPRVTILCPRRRLAEDASGKLRREAIGNCSRRTPPPQPSEDGSAASGAETGERQLRCDCSRARKVGLQGGGLSRRAWNSLHRVEASHEHNATRWHVLSTRVDGDCARAIPLLGCDPSRSGISPPPPLCTSCGHSRIA